ncbi:MAG TPA: hypothetical protein VGE58_10140 [Daejeonella sp.]
MRSIVSARYLTVCFFVVAAFCTTEFTTYLIGIFSESFWLWDIATRFLVVTTTAIVIGAILRQFWLWGQFLAERVIGEKYPIKVKAKIIVESISLDTTRCYIICTVINRSKTEKIITPPDVVLFKGIRSLCTNEQLLLIEGSGKATVRIQSGKDVKFYFTYQEIENLRGLFGKRFAFAVKFNKENYYSNSVSYITLGIRRDYAFKLLKGKINSDIPIPKLV